MDTTYLREDEIALYDNRGPDQFGKSWVKSDVDLLLTRLIEERKKNADDGWVSVGERLPDEVQDGESHYVLGRYQWEIFDSFGIFSYNIHRGNWMKHWAEDDIDRVHVTHWMPLPPTPPKEDK